ncbi:BTB/POZ domain-containing protein 2-like [Topomyia yanbarensis]|uniref:BTB/POZ domain-containing protein 2-like n=1 Tax=Topomyia yanbarensis TaxID=2498891 RepID=UPI00273CDF8D|nr:BTB/POZ domain-containing protein 2-like [Topomyia yanbarensis]
MEINKTTIIVKDSNDWQCSILDIKSRIKYLHETGTLCDCDFLVGEGSSTEKIAAHKFVLTVASPVFEAMFHGALAERNDRAIRVPDIAVLEFKELLTYIYMDQLRIDSVAEAIKLYYGAKKYMLPGAVAKCITYLESNQQAGTVCQVYEFAKFHGETNMMAKCIATMRSHTSSVITSSGFLNADLSTVITILDQDVLATGSELDLFKAIKKYATEHGLSRTDLSQQRHTREGVTVESASNQKQSKRQKRNKNKSKRCPSLKTAEMELFTTNNQTDEPKKDPEGVGARLKQDGPTILDALHRIRFLNLNPTNLAQELVGTELLTQSEAFAVLGCVSMHGTEHYTMPQGFSCSAKPRNSSGNQRYCCSTCGRYS